MQSELGRGNSRTRQKGDVGETCPVAFNLDPLSAWLAGANGFRCIWDMQMGPARQAHLGGDAFTLMHSHVVGSAGRPTGPRKHARLVCEWGLHTTALLLAAGCSS